MIVVDVVDDNENEKDNQWSPMIIVDMVDDNDENQWSLMWQEDD